MSLTDASHSWALFLTKSLWWNQSHKDRIKSKVQGIPESKSLHEILRVRDTPTPDDQPETQRGNALERSAPEGIEQRQKARSSDSPSCYTLHPTQLAWTMPPLCDPSPHSQRVCLFQSYHPHTHTQDGTSCAAKPLLHCTTVSDEKKVKTSVFTLSLLNLEGKCFSTDGRECGARDGLRFKTNSRRQFCRGLKLFESQALLCLEHTKTFLQEWRWEYAEWCGFFKVQQILT